MTFVKSLILSMVMTVVTFSVTTLRPAQESKPDPDALVKDAISNVIRNYVSLAREGRYNDLKQLTTSIPPGARNPHRDTDPTPSPLPPGTITVAPRFKGGGDKFVWLRRQLPQSLFQDQPDISKITDLRREKSLAKISIYLTGQEDLNPYIVMLTQNETGSWLIYDITIERFAKDYFP